MLDTPVLFLVFNRPDLTAQVLECIRKAKPRQLFIAADGPRMGKQGEDNLCSQVRSLVLNGINWECEVVTLFREENLGCKIAVSSAITWFFEHVEEGIILEDDCLPDSSFFKYCEAMLAKYKDDKKITQISGVNLMGISKEIKASYFFSRMGGIWGWATWRRVWKCYDVHIKAWGNKNTQNEILSFLDNKEWFNKLKESFDAVYNQRLDTWDYQFVFTQLYLKGLSIIPTKNLVANLGFRPDGTHTKNPGNISDILTKTYEVSHLLEYNNVIEPLAFYEEYYFSLLQFPLNKSNKMMLKMRLKLKILFSDRKKSSKGKEF